MARLVRPYRPQPSGNVRRGIPGLGYAAGHQSLKYRSGVMGHPRTVEQSDRYWRQAAVERLRGMGIKLNRFRQNAEGVASEIRRIEPAYRGGDPNLVIRAWMGAAAAPKVEVQRRTYAPSAAMRFAALRSQQAEPSLKALGSTSVRSYP
ncbi:hypothetical protein D0846_17535 [Bordetella avium]|uniref:hypothetical protein n=1 Tax=Bordetella avium TaxID=521 RepID=UPI000E69C17D|nr:hypothetical protein [Bordetella avium]RIQ38165.1 hypothetical protein D0847_17495 [Bordetella avium]RIQ38963.1 hypothetical protein D0846_17535 [Bordetella avium]RIQ67920.1 hypothetical protein D0836_17560 [Bordetella avium]